MKRSTLSGLTRLETDVSQCSVRLPQIPGSGSGTLLLEQSPRQVQDLPSNGEVVIIAFPLCLSLAFSLVLLLLIVIAISFKAELRCLADRSCKDGRSVM